MPSVRQLHRSVTNYDNSSTFRISKPAFQAYQLKPWVRDPEMEESLRSSLGIFGPQVQNEISRAKSVPVNGDKDNTSGRADLRTAHSVATVRELISLKPKSSLEALPIRPPLSRMKKIPGRYFPKPTTGDSQKVISFSTFRRYKPPVRTRSYGIGNSKSMDTSNLPMESSLFLDALPRLDRQGSPCPGSRRAQRPRRANTDFREVKSEVFAICFNTSSPHTSTKVTGDELHLIGGNEKPPQPSYDPNSELHSDYYTIKRVSVPSSSGKATTSLSLSNKTFSVVLRGQPKRLHPKLISLHSDFDGKSEGKSAGSHTAGEMSERDTTSINQKGDGNFDASVLDSVSRANKQESSVNAKIKVKIDDGLSFT